MKQLFGSAIQNGKKVESHVAHWIKKEESMCRSLSFTKNLFSNAPMSFLVKEPDRFGLIYS